MSETVVFQQPGTHRFVVKRDDGSYYVQGGGTILCEEMAKEIDRLRAALATPEVYAGVVQEQVAREREAAIARAAAAEVKLAQAKQACRRLIEQNLCWGHAEAARQVLEAMGEQP